MIFFNEQPDTLSMKFKSRLDLMDIALGKLDSFLRRQSIARIYTIRLALRELLSNAIKHGNHSDESLFTRCVVDCSQEDQVIVVVEDEGEGFDYSTLQIEPPDNPKDINKRGYILINALSSKIEFNKAGNRVTTHFNITRVESGERVLLEPDIMERNVS